MSVIEYVGMRYIPKVAEPLEWNSANEYEYFTIVQYLGDTYLSTKNVPANTEITNADYWIRFANFNGQYESIRKLLDIEKNVINYGENGTNTIIRKFNNLVNIEINFNIDDSTSLIGILPEKYRPNNILFDNSYSLFDSEYRGEWIASINENGLINVYNISANVINGSFISFSFTYFKD